MHMRQIRQKNNQTSIKRADSTLSAGALYGLSFSISCGEYLSLLGERVKMISESKSLGISSSSLQVLFQNNCSGKISQISRKTFVAESFFDEVLSLSSVTLK